MIDESVPKDGEIMNEDIKKNSSFKRLKPMSHVITIDSPSPKHSNTENVNIVREVSFSKESSKDNRLFHSPVSSVPIQSLSNGTEVEIEDKRVSTVEKGVLVQKELNGRLNGQNISVLRIEKQDDRKTPSKNIENNPRPSDASNTKKLSLDLSVYFPSNDLRKRRRISSESKELGPKLNQLGFISFEQEIDGQRFKIYIDSRSKLQSFLTGCKRHLNPLKHAANFDALESSELEVALLERIDNKTWPNEKTIGSQPLSKFIENQWVFLFDKSKVLTEEVTDLVEKLESEIEMSVNKALSYQSVSYTHLTLPTIYSV
eukprot:TRINITY_DN12634_c0_g1_i9.p1 TRINITY_DN12634_c0_g1~~TRINITY_DN12634_c0_g1_i9.p1  ORF type:complete len:316 (-),score=54.60 TRINITY_DN12634_c0_g1_i9:34-981(-)